MPESLTPVSSLPVHLQQFRAELMEVDNYRALLRQIRVPSKTCLAVDPRNITLDGVLQKLTAEARQDGVIYGMCFVLAFLGLERHEVNFVQGDDTSE